MSKAQSIIEKYSEIVNNTIDESQSNIDAAENLRKALHKAKFFYKKDSEHGSPFGTYTRNKEGTKHVVTMTKHPTGSFTTLHSYDGNHKDDYPSTTHKRLVKMGVL